MQNKNCWDLAIIGSGFAGLAAACRAHQNGRAFALIARDFGATQHFSGAFDGVDARLVDAALTARDFSWADILTRFCAAHPQHLYAQLFKNPKNDVPRFQDALRDFVAFYNLPVVGDAENPVWVIGASGFLKPAVFAWHSQGLTAREIAAAKKVVCVGFAGVWDYPVSLIAKNLAKIFTQVEYREYGQIPLMTSAPYVSVVKGLQNPETADAFLRFLQSELQSCDLVILPPVLPDDVLAKVTNQFPGRVKEMLGILPSVPGQRLQQRILDVFKTQKFFHCKQSVKSLDVEQNRILAAHFENAETLRAQNWVLATGKFVGGGVTQGQDQFYETLLHLPLAVGTQILPAQTHMTRLIDANASAEQPFLALGVPWGLASKPQNLQVCGHLLAGFDFTRQHCGFGVSVASAYHLDI